MCKDGHINYAYVLILTPKGKAYACFAVKKFGHNIYKAGCSFCSAVDRPNFDKKISRSLAKERLEKEIDIVTISFDDTKKSISMTDIVDSIIFSEELIAPNWAYKAFDYDLMFYTLNYDNLSLKEILIEEDCSEDYLLAYYL